MAWTLAPASRFVRHDVLPRFRANLRRLGDAYRLLADDVHRGQTVAPAGEWLLDNFHLVESEARSVRRDLPLRYYKTLPRLGSWELKGKARIHALALELIRHGDGRLDGERLSRFILAFQAVAPLSLGELWAWPSVLKLALLENLRQLTDGLLAARRARLLADQAFALLERGDSPGPLPVPLPDAFVAQLRQRMREYDPRLSPLATAVEAALAERLRTPEEAVIAAHQAEATDQVSASNTVTSLRFCATLNWSRFVEAVSPVEEILRRDPAGYYPKMDFASRDRYRHAVEELASGEPKNEAGEAQVKAALSAVESARRVAARAGSGEPTSAIT